MTLCLCVSLSGIIYFNTFSLINYRNDFLPHLPCLTIRDGGIDCLMYLYKRILPFLGGNFVENGSLNLMRVDVLLREIGQIEEALLRAAQRNEVYTKLTKFLHRKGNEKE